MRLAANELLRQSNSNQCVWARKLAFSTYRPAYHPLKKDITILYIPLSSIQKHIHKSMAQKHIQTPFRLDWRERFVARLLEIGKAEKKKVHTNNTR